ncbi:MAG: glycosyltransferase family 4 protein [Candidatus Acidiferrum sp.]
MRLAVVSPFVDRRHGTERALAELLERLAGEYGYEIHLYAQRVEDLPVADAKSARSSNSGAIFWHKVPSIRGPQLLQFSSWFLLNKIWRFRDRRIRGLRCELLFSPGINCLDAKVILVHAVFHRLAEMSEPPRGGGLRNLHRRSYYWILSTLERKIYSNERIALAAVSNHSARQLQQYFGRRDVPIIPNGVDTKIFNAAARAARRDAARQRWHLSTNECVLLLIGNDWKTKGLPVLLQAAAECRELPLRLLLVGKEDPSEWTGRISRLELANRVSFLAPAADVLDFYAAADVYVAPSLEDSFNLPALEAMACSLPVVVSASAGISEWIQDGVNGLVLKDPLDDGELAASLRKLASSPEARRRMGENADRTAATLSWDRHAEAVHDLLVRSLAPQA